MNYKVFSSQENLYTTACQRLAQEIKDNRDLALGLAAGNTPTLLYKKLIHACKQGELSFKGVRTFNLDEFVGVARSDPSSFDFYMRDALLNHIDIDPAQTFSLDGLASNLEEECLNYEKKIASLGYLDVQVLGLGQNGHIAFNEPGSDVESLSRPVQLSQASKMANAYRFQSEVPDKALTMGIGTILKSKKILLLACGETKAKAVWHLLRSETSKDWPCSYLQGHPNIECFFDSEAASLL